MNENNYMETSVTGTVDSIKRMGDFDIVEINHPKTIFETRLVLPHDWDEKTETMVFPCGNTTLGQRVTITVRIEDEPIICDTVDEMVEKGGL